VHDEGLARLTFDFLYVKVNVNYLQKTTNEVGDCSLAKLFQASLRAERVLCIAENPTKNVQLALKFRFW